MKKSSLGLLLLLIWNAWNALALADEYKNNKVQIVSLDLPGAAGPGLSKPVTAAYQINIRGTDTLATQGNGTKFQYYILAESSYLEVSSDTVAGIANSILKIDNPGTYSVQTTFTVDERIRQGVYEVLGKVSVYREPDGKLIGAAKSSGLTGIVTELHLGATVVTEDGTTLYVSSTTDSSIIDPNAIRAGVEFPEGAITEPVLVTIDLDPFLEYSNLSAGPAVVLGPDNYVFSRPVTITVPYDAYAFEMSNTLEADAGMVVFDDTMWTTLDHVTPDVFQNVVTATTRHFSAYQSVTGYRSTYDVFDSLGNSILAAVPELVKEEPNYWTKAAYNNADMVFWWSYELEALSTFFMTDYVSYRRFVLADRSNPTVQKLARAAAMRSIQILALEAANYKDNAFCEFPRRDAGLTHCQAILDETNTDLAASEYAITKENPIFGPDETSRGWGIRSPRTKDKTYVAEITPPFTQFGFQTGLALKGLLAAEYLFRQMAIIDPDGIVVPSDLLQVANVVVWEPEGLGSGVKVPVNYSTLTWAELAYLARTYSRQVLEHWLSNYFRHPTVNGVPENPNFAFFYHNSVPSSYLEINSSAFGVFPGINSNAAIHNQSNIMAVALFMLGDRLIELGETDTGQAYRLEAGNVYNLFEYSLVKPDFEGYTYNPTPRIWSGGWDVSYGKQMFTEDYSHSNLTIELASLMHGLFPYNTSRVLDSSGQAFATYTASEILQAFRTCYRAKLWPSSTLNREFQYLGQTVHMSTLQATNGLNDSPWITESCGNPGNQTTAKEREEEAKSLGETAYPNLRTFAHSRFEVPLYTKNSQYGIQFGWATLGIADGDVGDVALNWADASITQNVNHADYVEHHGVVYNKAGLGGGPYFLTLVRLAHTYASRAWYWKTGKAIRLQVTADPAPEPPPPPPVEGCQSTSFENMFAPSLLLFFIWALRHRRSFFLLVPAVTLGCGGVGKANETEPNTKVVPLRAGEYAVTEVLRESGPSIFDPKNTINIYGKPISYVEIPFVWGFSDIVTAKDKIVFSGVDQIDVSTPEEPQLPPERVEARLILYSSDATGDFQHIRYGSYDDVKSKTVLVFKFAQESETPREDCTICPPGGYHGR